MREADVVSAASCDLSLSAGRGRRGARAERGRQDHALSRPRRRGGHSPRASIELDGRDVTSEPLWRRARRGMGYVPQTPSVLWDLTVEDNLATFEALVPRARRSRARRSWAERRRARRARSRCAQASSRAASGGASSSLGPWSRDRRVLVCDEPFAGIDPAGAERLGRLLQARAEAGTAVVARRPPRGRSAARLPSRRALVDGRIEAAGPPEEFREHPLVVGRYLGIVVANASAGHFPIAGGPKGRAE